LLEYAIPNGILLGVYDGWLLLPIATETTAVGRAYLTCIMPAPGKKDIFIDSLYSLHVGEGSKTQTSSSNKQQTTPPYP